MAAKNRRSWRLWLGERIEIFVLTKRQRGRAAVVVAPLGPEESRKAER